MKKLFLSALVAVGLLQSASALNLTYPLPTGSTSMSNLVLLSSATISQVTIANATSTPTTIAFFDNNVTNLVVTNASWVTTTYTSQSVTNTYTNYFGVPTTNIYTALVASSVTNAAATNLVNMPLSIVAPTNTTIVLDGTYRFFKGLVLTNGNAAVTVSLTYQQ